MVVVGPDLQLCQLRQLRDTKPSCHAFHATLTTVLNPLHNENKKRSDIFLTLETLLVSALAGGGASGVSKNMTWKHIRGEGGSAALLTGLEAHATHSFTRSIEAGIECPKNGCCIYRDMPVAHMRFSGFQIFFSVSE